MVEGTVKGEDMEFKKYQHIERFGTDEVEGIEIGDCYVFPKIDGTNGSIWLEDGEVKAGSRKRVLTLDSDNQGFYAAVKDDERIKAYLEAHPTHRLYGEWLVPHSLKTYRDEAWRKFYIFDVVDTEKETEDSSVYAGYIPYPDYKEELDKYGLDYIPALRVIKNGSLDNFLKVIEENTYLIKDGQGVGEGIVIKNYAYFNKYGRQTWAKIVRNEFKDLHRSRHETPKIDVESVESRIVDKYLTSAFIDKEFEKIKEQNGGFSSKNISEFLGRVWHEFIVEESWHFVKGEKMPTIDFKKLNKLVINKVKQEKPEVF